MADRQSGSDDDPDCYQLAEQLVSPAQAAKIVYQTDDHDGEACQQKSRQKKTLIREPALGRARAHERHGEAAHEGQQHGAPARQWRRLAVDLAPAVGPIDRAEAVRQGASQRRQKKT